MSQLDRNFYSGEGYGHMGRSHNTAERNSSGVWQSRIEAAGSIEAMARYWSPRFSQNGHKTEPLESRLAYTFGPQFNESPVYHAASIAAQEVTAKH